MRHVQASRAARTHRTTSARTVGTNQPKANLQYSNARQQPTRRRRDTTINRVHTSKAIQNEAASSREKLMGRSKCMLCVSRETRRMAYASIKGKKNRPNEYGMSSNTPLIILVPFSKCAFRELPLSTRYMWYWTRHEFPSSSVCV